MKKWLKKITLDGEYLGTTFCRSCATRHVFNLLITKRGFKILKVEQVRATLVETDTELQFRTPTCD